MARFPKNEIMSLIGETPRYALGESTGSDAGALCCVRLKPAVFNDVAVGHFYDVLAGEDVRVANGTWFGEDARVFRLGFGFLSMPDLEAGLAILSAAVRRSEAMRGLVTKPSALASSTSLRVSPE